MKIKRLPRLKSYSASRTLFMPPGCLGLRLVGEGHLAPSGQSACLGYYCYGSPIDDPLLGAGFPELLWMDNESIVGERSYVTPSYCCLMWVRVQSGTFSMLLPQSQDPQTNSSSSYTANTLFGCHLHFQGLSNYTQQKSRKKWIHLFCQITVFKFLTLYCFYHSSNKLSPNPLILCFRKRHNFNLANVQNKTKNQIAFFVFVFYPENNPKT